MVIITEFDKKDLSALSDLPDDVLRERILAALSSCGIDKSAAARRLPDMKIIKKKLASLTDRDIKTLAAAFGEENVCKLRDGLINGSK